MLYRRSKRQVTYEKLIYIAKELLLNRRSEYNLVELVKIYTSKTCPGEVIEEAAVQIVKLISKVHTA